MKLTIRKSASLDDWYTIERAEHDGRMWMEPMEGGRMALRCSARFSDADVEGTAEEMRAIAAAIRAGMSAVFRRCAVYVASDTVELWSPRNSMARGAVTLAEALALADDIERSVP